MTRLTTVTVVLALTAACANSASGVADRADVETNNGGAFTPEDGFTYELDVYPNAPTDGTAESLAQTFFSATDAATELDLLLRSPVEITGVLSGFVAAPQAFVPLPGADAPLDADLSLLLEGTVQSRYGVTDDLGAFRLAVIPGDTYTLVIRPNNALVPFSTEAIDISQDRVLDRYRGEGLPIWGQVLDDLGAPMAGIPVYATDGVAEGWPSITDANGWYEVRVTPGVYRVVSEGQDSGRDPRLESALVPVVDTGVRRDLRYPDLQFVSVGGRVANAGVGVPGGRVRFTAEQLDAYPTDRAAQSIEAITNSTGLFDTRLVSGTYTIDVLPPPESAISPTRIEHVHLNQNTDLGSMLLSGFRSLQGTVTADGQDGAPARGLQDATLRCEELLGDQRSFTTVTHADGLFSFSLPVGEVACVVMPTAGRDDLALRRVEADLTTTDTLNVTLIPGTIVSGVVRGEDGSPAPFAEVRVLDTKGNLWGTALTNPTGRFETRVAWPLADGG